MSTIRKTKTTTTYAVARSAREEAERLHTQAEAALQTARDHHADVVARNRKGDRTVTGLDLLTADANVTAAQGHLSAAADAVAEARRVEAPLLAEHWATDISGRLAEAEGDLIATAVEEITASLRKLTERTTERHTLFSTAIEEAGAAGIEGDGNQDGLPFGYIPGGFSSPGTVFINGKRIDMTEPPVVIRNVLDASVRDLGFYVTIRNGEVTVLPLD